MVKGKRQQGNTTNKYTGTFGTKSSEEARIHFYLVFVQGNGNNNITVIIKTLLRYTLREITKYGLRIYADTVLCIADVRNAVVRLI